MAALTWIHVIISLIGIATGFVVVNGMLRSDPMDRWTVVFLVTTAATSITGFFFPVEHLLPSHIVGALSLLVLAVAIPARYIKHLAGAWRWLYVVGATIALYFNMFVLVVQAFLKVPALKALAPTQSEPPFAAAQGVVLVAFLVLGVMTVKRFRPQS